MEERMEYREFKYSLDRDYEDDNIKNWHIIVFPNGETDYLDLSPYEFMTPEAFVRVVFYFQTYGHLPQRKTNGPLRLEDLMGLNAPDPILTDENIINMADYR